MIKNLSFHFIFTFTIIFLLILGYWQTQRLEWKNNLINSIQQNYSEYLEEFPFHLDNSNEYEFMKVITSGYLKFENTMYFFRSNLNGASGFELIVPMQTEENKFIYVILGWIPYDIKQNFDISSLDNFDLFEAEGALIYSKERKPLIPQNDYASNVWYLMNTEEMDQYHKISSSRYLIKLLDQTRFQNLLIEFEPSNITNNHLQYAVTWFLLSIVIAVMYMYYIRRGAKKDEL